MEKGYLASKLVGWGDKRISNWSLPGVFEAEAVIGKGPLIENREAYRCKKCKLIVFNAEKSTRKQSPVYRTPSRR
jgi:hypothetical protein